MSEDNKKRKACTYGERCYRKNPNHMKQFYHPEKDCSTEPAADSKVIKQTMSETETSENRVENISESLEQALTKKYMIENVENNADDIKALIKSRFCFEMPADFYLLWELAQSVMKKTPQNFLSSFNLKLVGPFTVLYPNSASCSSNLPSPEDSILAWRYYYDVPEFQTVVVSTVNSFHIGFYRDDPEEMPSLVCSNIVENGCKFYIIGDNLVGALHFYLATQCKNIDKNLEDEKRSLIEKLEKLAEENALTLKPANSQKIKQRKKRVVANTFHSVGIVVPVVDDVGYRPIGETEANLRKWVNIIDETDEQAIRDEKMEKIFELINYVQFANDECDYGMGLELGIDLFCTGSKLIHKQVEQLLVTAYELLNRRKFAEILKIHLKSRKIDL